MDIERLASRAADLRRRGILAVLSCVVVLVTASALMIPAITMTDDDIPNGVVEYEQEDTVLVLEEEAEEPSEEAVDETAEPEAPEEATAEEPVADDSEPVPSADAPSAVPSAEERTFTASVGRDYRVTVTCSADSGIPIDDADLSVTEITAGDSAYDTSYDEYVSSAEDALGLDEGSADYVRLFDIKIVDADDPSVTYQPDPGATVDVRIELADSQSDELSVVHFAEGEDAGDVVEGSKTESGTVSFEADGFSVYAIVDGPDAVPMGWHKVTSLDELDGAGPFYIGQTDGYYFKDTTVSTSEGRIGIAKTTPAHSSPQIGEAAKYYFEKAPDTTNQFYAYCLAADGTTKRYVHHGTSNDIDKKSLSFAESEEGKTAFTVTVNADNGKVTFAHEGWYWNMQNGATGNRFCSWSSADNNSSMCIWYHEDIDDDPLDLDGKSYALLVWGGGVTAKAMTGAQSESGTNLLAEILNVMTNKDDQSDKLYVPKVSSESTTTWTFTWVRDDVYYLSAVVDGATKYLKIDADGLHLVDEPSEIQVFPGAGNYKGRICLKSGDGGTTLMYSGEYAKGFCVDGDFGSGTEWLYLAKEMPESALTDEYQKTYTARKVSVSDLDKVKDGAQVVVYTRAWNEEKKEYEYYAINGDGLLVRCYESGDSIEWIGGSLNDMMWQFTEYTYDDGSPTNYYELRNAHSKQYLAPLITGGQTLSPNTIGIMLPGRRDGQYYSPILTWDTTNYSFAGVKVNLDEGEGASIRPCVRAEAMDFYFAILEDVPVDDAVHTVPTVDNYDYGITMKMVDIETRAEMSDFLGNNAGGMGTVLHQGMLSTDLPDGKYPVATKDGGGSLATLYEDEQDVNHLFIESTYEASGYFEYDSAQNFASLKGKTSGDFTVYQELGSYDSGGDKHTLKHGQFFPYNDLKPGLFASVNGENLYSPRTDDVLLDSDPRKHEQLYLVQNVDCYFAMELEASFVQTPSGLDAWGHDIIFEFSGDDDFWLYVDGELVIDLGGIHSAVPGTVNFRTGDVNVNGDPTTLRDVFYDNYLGRGHTAEEAQAYVDDLFEQNSDGQWVFKDNTTHTMRIFYMERGAGASNLHMRFNLASVKKGTVQLSKELEGVDASESSLAVFPYQVWYKMEGDDTEYLLTNMIPGDDEALPEHFYPHADQTANYVLYKDSTKPVDYRKSLAVNGVEYESVFLLKPGETAEISFPTYDEKTVASYRIVECGVDPDAYERVYANGTLIDDPVVHESAGVNDYGIDYDTTENRSKVNYVNAARSTKALTIQKELYRDEEPTPVRIDLYDAAGEPIDHDNPDLERTFDFRLYFKTAYDTEYTAANMHTYHVKDPAGCYCKWDTVNQKFVRITNDEYPDGITDYALLTDDVVEGGVTTYGEKTLATFDTSMNGSVSQIPAYYTVEVRGLVPGTAFMVVERPNETPDGYKFWQYQLDDWPPTADGYDPWKGVEGVIGTSADSAVTVRNYKGYGLHLDKKWADADIMKDRDPAYFAVFKKGEGDALTFVEGSVQKLVYAANPQSLSWFYIDLPLGGVLDDYAVYEVTATVDVVYEGEDDEVGTEVYSDVVPVRESGKVRLHGTPKVGEAEDIDYEVTYADPVKIGDNTLSFEATNKPADRPAVKVVKVDWEDEALPGAGFTLAQADGELIGSFTSRDDGFVTEQYLQKDVPYVLEETSSPQGYHGLEQPLTLTLTYSEEGGWVLNASAAGDGEVPDGYYDVEKVPVTETSAEYWQVTVRNRPYDFQVVKVDETDHNVKIGDVTFKLYVEKTAGDAADWVLMTFDEDGVTVSELVTDANGVIPHLDKDLPAGKYQLRETQPASGYDPLPSAINFTVTPKGDIVFGEMDGVEFDADTEGAVDRITYTLTVGNVPGMVLPETGGPGTLPFTVCGALLIVVAACVLAIRRRA